MTLPYFLRKDGSFGPLALAHRGFSLDGLENSMAAFHAAVELGTVHVETDVHTTADRLLVVFHDASLDRVTNAAGRIAELTGDEVTQARIGGVEPVPTFDQLVTALPGAKLNLDLKDWNSVGPMAEAIERHGIHSQVLVTSFSDRRRRAVLKRLDKRVASSAGSTLTALFVFLGPILPAALARRLLADVDVFQVPVRYGRFRVVSEGFIRRAHRIDRLVHVWTINERAEMERLLDLGVDGIVSDRLDLLKQVLIERDDWV
ncbi:glycerophosphodiester phosphodiesterase [Paenarthrobacter ureafaciens]|uniref:glycerophosphodiester phosphodiesterase n=1 Tax=Paenarthrobacter TaxID=1742992 RepID=UPI00076CAE59|nr:glycerophosphodiester phosphodiesterase [Paenarthrobacter ureafaciens]KUR63268.1 glycerophosphodiester phosphodiesterase [Arthrobacter sp. ATCC 21022]NWL27535.1 glycerophosphodiester phosphodiesterase [Paenarthrobacter ureafaciens]RWW95038.1 glycerophosphodiester phosphodiesterase [Paenarthrobacter ureafaciens]